jgi:predicted nuclease with TOPRIM domain
MTEERLHFMLKNAGNWSKAGCLEFVSEIERLRAENKYMHDRFDALSFEIQALKVDKARLREALRELNDIAEEVFPVNAISKKARAALGTE